MPILCRPAREEDLERSDRLVVASINDLTQRHGFGPIAAAHPPDFQLFSLKDDAGGLWVAEEADKILGFAWSWVCGDLWFLAQLFVSPEHQGRNIGNELLKRTFEHAKKSNATNRALITFAFNTVSQGLYIRNGLFPRFPIYNFSVSRDLLMSRLQRPQFRPISLADTASDLQKLANIDARVLGISREKHHRYLLNDRTTRGVGLYRRRLRRLYLRQHRRPHRTARRGAARRAWLCVYECTGSCGGDWFSARDGLPSRRERSGSKVRGRARDAHHLSDAVDVDTRFWRLDRISAPQSGFHVRQ
jgi:GNAT superfamily N-acetyltransferase